MAGMNTIAAVLAAQQAAARINAQLSTASAPAQAATPMDAKAAAAAAAARINAMLAAKGVISSADTTPAAPVVKEGPQQLWPWAKSDPNAPPLVILDEKAGEEEYMKLAGLTIKGLRKLGYTGGPIMGEKEAAGIRFGLHRAGFTPRGIEYKTVKLLIGLEADVCQEIGFPLVEKLKGPGNSFLIHIMKSCPGVLVAVQGKGSKVEGDQDPLHLRMSAADDRTIQAAQLLADSLILTVKQDYDVRRMQVLQQQMMVAAGAAGAGLGAGVAALPLGVGAGAGAVPGVVAPAYSDAALAAAAAAAAAAMPAGGMVPAAVYAGLPAGAVAAAVAIPPAALAAAGEKRKFDALGVADTAAGSAAAGSAAAGAAAARDTRTATGEPKRKRFRFDDEPPQQTAASSQGHGTAGAGGAAHSAAAAPPPGSFPILVSGAGVGAGVGSGIAAAAPVAPAAAADEYDPEADIDDD